MEESFNGEFITTSLPRNDFDKIADTLPRFIVTLSSDRQIVYKVWISEVLDFSEAESNSSEPFDTTEIALNDEVRWQHVPCIKVTFI